MLEQLQPSSQPLWLPVRRAVRLIIRAMRVSPITQRAKTPSMLESLDTLRRIDLHE